MKNPTLQIHRDDVAERLDEVALIAAAYKQNRDAGRPTTILRRALLDAARDAVDAAINAMLDAKAAKARVRKMPHA